MKNKIIVFAIALMSFNFMGAQSVVGDWTGTLEVQGTTLEVIFHITGEDGALKSTMDSPNQGAFGIEMDLTSFENNKLKITAKQMQMEFEGELDQASSEITGTFNQGPMSLPLNIKKKSATALAKQEATNNHPIAGDWNGALDVMGQKLRLTFHITEDKGSFSSTMDSPDQKAFGIPVDETIVEGNEITIKVSNARINMTGTFDKELNTIEANFNQAGRDMPLNLTREEVEKQEVNRPQEPKTFDYKQEEVKFQNEKGGHELAGTLTIPSNGTFEKVAIMVSGSGPQDRNEELLGHKPFLVISDYLTKNGIAVLRYDDRGVGESGGDFQKATSEDFATDAEAALSFLRSRKDMEGKKFGIVGHSEGGMIAPIVASRTPIDYIVLLAGPGTELDVLLEEQSRAISKASGIDEAKIDFNAKASAKMFDYMKANNDLNQDDFEKGMTSLLAKEMDKLSDADKAEIGDMKAEIDNQIKTISTPWFRYFLSFSPYDHLVKVKCPVLAITGENDLQVLAKSNLEAIEKALSDGGNGNYTIKELPKLNHLFQVSETGDPAEYGKIEETFNQDALELLANWINSYNK